MVNDGNWHHVCFVRAGKDGSEYYIWIDGSNQNLNFANNQTQDTGVTTGYNPYIAGLNNGGTMIRPFTGNLSQIRIYDHALTQQEINYLYQVGSRGLHTSDKRTL